MSTELSIIDQQELDAFIAQTGASAEDLTGGGDYLPNLKVNFHDEDANKKEIKPGTFFVTGQEIPVYTKTVNIRPLLHGYQWTQWDDTAKKTVNRTIFISNFNEEARDEKGTVRCGKPPGKVLRDNKELAEKYEDITLYRTIHVLVSYTGTDADGVEHVIENLPSVMRLKGSNFMPFGEEYIDNLPKGSVLWDFESKLTLEKKKEGTVNYWVTHFDTDFSKKVALTVDVFETMKAMQSRINSLNKEVNEKYYEAKRSQTADNDAIDALDITPRVLSEDFDSGIPF